MESLEKAVEKSGIENSMAKYQSVQELSATVNRLASTATH
jgi:hypothetical protein